MSRHDWVEDPTAGPMSIADKLVVGLVCVYGLAMLWSCLDYSWQFTIHLHVNLTWLAGNLVACLAFNYWLAPTAQRRLGMVKVTSPPRRRLMR